MNLRGSIKAIFFLAAIWVATPMFSQELNSRERLLTKIVIMQHFLSASRNTGLSGAITKSPYEMALTGESSLTKLKTIALDNTQMPSLRLAASEGLAYLGDSTGIQVLKDTVFGDFALSNSCFEKSHAALALLYLGYKFPPTFSFSSLPNPLYSELDLFLK